MYIQCTYNINRSTLGVPNYWILWFHLRVVIHIYIYTIMFATCKYIDICKVTLSVSSSFQIALLILIILTMGSSSFYCIWLSLLFLLHHHNPHHRHHHHYDHHDRNQSRNGHHHNRPTQWCLSTSQIWLDGMMDAVFFQWPPQTGQLMQSSIQRMT